MSRVAYWNTGVTAVPASLSRAEGWGLLARARTGSGRQARQHAAQLVAVLRPAAFALAFRLLQDRALAEDAVQEAFIRLWRGRASDQGTAQISSYFHTIVAHEAIRLLRRHARESVWAPEDLSDWIDHQSSQSPEPEAGLPAGLDPSALEAALGALPDRQRAALVLWAYEDASPAEIARALELSPNAAYQLLHRARQSLKTALFSGPAA